MVSMRYRCGAICNSNNLGGGGRGEGAKLNGKLRIVDNFHVLKIVYSSIAKKLTT